MNVSKHIRGIIGIVIVVSLTAFSVVTKSINTPTKVANNDSIIKNFPLLSSAKTTQNQRKRRKLLSRHLSLSTSIRDIQQFEDQMALLPEITTDFPSITPLKRGKYWLSSKYGNRYHPIKKKNKRHNGVDLAAAKMTPVYATANGKVTITSTQRYGYGTHIIIQHKYGFSSLYGHLTKYVVKVNQTVFQGQLIGYVGSTGASTGNHLHYEVRKENNSLDPFDTFNIKFKIYDKFKKIM